MRFESLEDRRLLATLGIDIRFLADDQGAAGAELQTPILRGEAFWVDVRVQDVRSGTPAGVIALPLNLSWDPTAFALTSDDNLTPQGVTALPRADPLISDALPLQRAVSQYDAAAPAFDPGGGSLLDFFNLRGVRGAALPNNDIGRALGSGAAETFSSLRFVAIANASEAPFTVNLDGSMSFADAAPLDAVSAVGNANDMAALANTVEATVSIVGGQISGTKFDDLNGNGIRDVGEPGVAGVTIEAMPVAPTSGPLTIQTAVDGGYRFADLPAGRYTLREAGGGDSIVTLPAANRYDVQLSQPTPTAPDRDFGNFAPIQFSGTVFEDVDGDGTRDAGDPAMPGVTVRLDLNSDGATTGEPSVTTDAQGRYVFRDIGPGTHTVTEVLPAGFRQTTPASGAYVVMATSGQDREGLDFGNQVVPAANSLSGFVYVDTDLDGTQDANEFGLPGWTIDLLRDGTATPLRTTTTAADGSYFFDDLPGGVYRVVQTQQPRFVDASITLGQVLPSGETRGVTDGWSAFAGIELGGDETAVNYNFGESLGAVNKRFFLSTTNPRRELCAASGAACQSVSGTAGDDTIRVARTASDTLQVTVNDRPPVVVPAAAASVVLVEGGGGQDQVAVIGSPEDESFSASPTTTTSATATLTTALQQLGVFGAGQIEVRGGGGSDLGVLRDSTQADMLTASGRTAELESPAGDSIQMIDMETLVAIASQDDRDDRADVEVIDFVLRLGGTWV